MTTRDLFKKDIMWSIDELDELEGEIENHNHKKESCNCLEVRSRITSLRNEANEMYWDSLQADCE